MTSGAEQFLLTNQEERISRLCPLIVVVVTLATCEVVPPFVRGLWLMFHRHISSYWVVAFSEPAKRHFLLQRNQQQTSVFSVRYARQHSRRPTWLAFARSYRTEGAIGKWRKAVPPPTAPMEVAIVTVHQNLSQCFALREERKWKDVMTSCQQRGEGRCCITGKHASSVLHIYIFLELHENI